MMEEAGIESWLSKNEKGSLKDEWPCYSHKDSMSLHARKKRKREVRELHVDQNGPIFRLPDEVLLSVFKYLTTEELILAGGYAYL